MITLHIDAVTENDPDGDRRAELEGSLGFSWSAWSGHRIPFRVGDTAKVGGQSALYFVWNGFGNGEGTLEMEWPLKHMWCDETCGARPYTDGGPPGQDMFRLCFPLPHWFGKHDDEDADADEDEEEEEEEGDEDEDAHNRL